MTGEILDLDALEQPIDMEDADFKKYYSMGKEDMPMLTALNARKTDRIGKVVAIHCRTAYNEAHPCPKTPTEAAAAEAEGIQIKGKATMERIFKLLTFLAVLLVIAASGGVVAKELIGGGFVIVAGAEGANNTTGPAGDTGDINTDTVLLVAGWAIVVALVAYYAYTAYRKKQPKDLKEWGSMILKSLEDAAENPFVRRRIDLFWDSYIKPALNDLAKKVLGEGETLDSFRVQVAKWGMMPWDKPIPGYGEPGPANLPEEEGAPEVLTEGPPKEPGN